MVLDGEIPFRAAFKTALDQGRAVAEASFQTLRKHADAMAQNTVEAVAAAVHLPTVIDGSFSSCTTPGDKTHVNQ